MPPALIQLISAVGGAVITGLVMAYAANQSHKQSEIATLLATLQADNRDLREENKQLREELDALQANKPKRRDG